jgi:Xaa-Pro dipeptidase
MVVTVEPGIYLEGKFGLRVEDMILIKNRGKILTNLPRKSFFKD